MESLVLFLSLLAFLIGVPTFIVGVLKISHVNKRNLGVLLSILGILIMIAGLYLMSYIPRLK